MVNARPAPPRSSDAYPWGNFKINSDRITCATENTTTPTMNPDTDNETPGTTHAATSSPIAHDPRSTTARSRICLTAISVGLEAVAGKNRVDSYPGLGREAVRVAQIVGPEGVADVLDVHPGMLDA